MKTYKPKIAFSQKVPLTDFPFSICVWRVLTRALDLSYCAAAVSERAECGLASPLSLLGHSGSLGGSARTCLAMVKTLREKRKLDVLNQSSVLRAGGSPDRR